MKGNSMKGSRSGRISSLSRNCRKAFTICIVFCLFSCKIALAYASPKHESTEHFGKYSRESSEKHLRDPASASSTSSASFSPFQQSKIQFSVSALFLRPSSNMLDFAVLSHSVPSFASNLEIQSLKLHYKPGFQMGAVYVFPNECADIQLNWWHLKTSASRFVVSNRNQFISPLYRIGAPAAIVREARGHTKFHYDVVNLDAGLFACFCHEGNETRDWKLRFFTGLSAAELKQHLTSNFQGNVLQGNTPDFSFTSQNASKFSGLGPRFGIGGAHGLVDYLSVVGHMAGSLLVGNQHANTYYHAHSNALLPTGVFDNHHGIFSRKANQVVPGVDARLGLQFNLPACDAFSLSLEAGYQAATYLNAITAYNPNAVVSTIQTGSLPAIGMEKRQSHFSVDGPYLNFKLGF